MQEAKYLFIKSESEKWKSCPTLCNSMDYSPWNSPGQNAGVGSLSLLQGIFPTQGSNPGLPHCRWIIYQLSHEGSPTTLEWVASIFSSESSWPRNRTGSPALQADSSPSELSEKQVLLNLIILKLKIIFNILMCF